MTTPPSDGPWVSSVEEVIGHVGTGERIGVSGFHYTRAPLALLRALLASPVTDLHYVSWGGGLPLEVLLTGSQVARLTVCFSSLEVYGLAPRFRRAVEDGAVEFDEMTALSLITGLRAEGEHVDFGVMQAPDGSEFATALRGADSSTVPLVEVPAIELDAFLLHAQRADDDGNVEIDGARGLDLSCLMAAKKVLVTVEERVRTGSLGAPRAHVLPRHFVSAVAVAPFGAYPTACLPYYGSDLVAVADAMEAQDDEAFLERLVPSDESARLASARGAVARLARVGARELDRSIVAAAEGRVASSDADAGEPSRLEILIGVIASSVSDASLCAFGSASLIPAAAYLLAKRTHAPGAVLMSSNGGYIDLAERAMHLELAEPLDFATSSAFMGGDENYHWFAQSGRISHEVVGSAQVDRRGATNNLWISKADGGRIRLPGQGGMADVANLHENFLIYLPRQSTRNLVELVDRVSSSRAWLSDRERTRYRLHPGVVRVMTDLAVFALDEATGLLRVESVHPGVGHDELRSSTGFPLDGLDVAPLTPVPDAATLTALRCDVDPLGVASLDMVPARERVHRIREILARERALLE